MMKKKHVLSAALIFLSVLIGFLASWELFPVVLGLVSSDGITLHLISSTESFRAFRGFGGAFALVSR